MPPLYQGITQPHKGIHSTQFLLGWMNSRVYYTQWSKKEKDKYHICIYVEIYIYHISYIYIHIYLWRQQWRLRYRIQTCGHKEGRRGWDELRRYGNIYITIRKIRQPVEICCVALGSSIRCSLKPRGVDGVRDGGGSFKREGQTNAYGRSVLMYGRNQHRYSKAIILSKQKKISVWTSLHECLLSWNILRIQVVEGGCA